MLVAAEHLSIAYTTQQGSRVEAVRDVCLEIGEGEIVGMVGDSGSGKSTLALAFCGMLPASAVVLQGAVRWGREGAGARSAALIPQSPSLFFSPYLRCGEQVRDVLLANGVGPREAQERVRVLLRDVGLPDAREVASAWPHELSGGELQRLAIARALAFQPRLLVADEATSSLDEALASSIRRSLEAIAAERGVAVLWITHLPAELAGFAKRVVAMDAGTLMSAREQRSRQRESVSPAALPYLEVLSAGVEDRP